MAISNKTLFALRAALNAFTEEAGSDSNFTQAVKDAHALDGALATHADQKSSDSHRTENSFSAASAKAKAVSSSAKGTNDADGDEPK